MNFTLDATGAQAAGQGLGNIFKAIAMAPMIRQQAEQQSAMRSAQAYSANQLGNLNGTKAAAERYTLNQRQAPIDTSAAPEMQTLQKLFQMGLPGKAHELANAGGELQRQSIKQKALQNIGDLDMANRYNALTKDGQAYMPMDNIGNTGRVFNKATGEGALADATLAKLFDDVQRSSATENYAQANSANASAGNANASRMLTLEKLGILKDTGRLPGSGGSGEDATNAKTRNTVMTSLIKSMPDATPQEIEAAFDQAMTLMDKAQGHGRPAAVPASKPAAKPAAASKPQEVKSINGKNYVNIGGQWFEQ